MNGMWLVAAAFALAACSGSGSDIGPVLAKLPSASSKFVVLDDQGRGVVEARVSVLGTSITGTTGRNGRGDLLADPRGRQRLQVDGSAAAAVAGDMLGTLTFAAPLSGGDLPAVTFLPDVAASVGASLPVGTQTATTLIDDSATSGARLTIANGSSLGLANGAATFTVRTGSLQRAHLPGDLPTTSGAAMLFGRGIYLDPPAMTLTGALLDVPDDLSLSGGVTATLYHLDETSGEWTSIASGIASSGGRLAQAVAVGGLYVFATSVAAGSVGGRIVDATATPLQGMLVSVDGTKTTTDSAGRFLVAAVAAQDASGADRPAAIEVFAGGIWLPMRATASAAMNGTALIDVGDIALDTVYCGNVRVQQVKRARAEPIRRCGISSLYGSVAQATISDALGQAVFEDVPSRWFGFQEGHPLDGRDVYYAQAVGHADAGRRWTDVRQFFSERGWYVGSRRARVLVTDALGGGPIQGAVLVRGSADGAGFADITREGGTVYADRQMEGRATATLRTQRDGRTIVHAFTIDAPNGEHLEMPMQQVLRTTLGAFDRHGLVAGTLLGADPTRQHRLRVTRRLELQEWWDDVFAGIAIPSALPIDVDPAVTHGAFRAGVATAGGHLAASEVSTVGMVTTLGKLGIVADLVPTAATVVARDIALDLPATGAFTVPNALVGLDAGIGSGSLTFSLALEQPSSRVVDIVRGIGGNHVANGSDLVFALPAFGPNAGHRWLVALRGTAVVGGETIVQQSLLRLLGGTAETAVEMLPVPTITAPAAGASVGASGFTVQFTLPANTQFATLELRSDVAGELHLWQVTLPGTATEFAFRLLPTEATMPLVAGRTYALMLTAFRAAAGLPTSAVLYRDFTSYLQSIGVAERGVDAVSARTIQVTAN